VNLRASALRSTRLPTFTELYYRGAGDYHPNPGLKPETAMTYRLTAEAVSLSKVWHGEASVWYRRTRDVIDWEQRPDTDTALDGHWWSTQLNRLGTVGGEVSVRTTPASGLPGMMLSYGYIHSDMSVATGYISKYALDYMRHKLSAVMSVAVGRELVLILTGSYYDRVGSYLVPDPADATRSIQRGYRPYFLLDGRLSWEPSAGRLGERLRGLEIYLDGTNLTGTDYFDFGGLPMPGTWLSAGIVVTIR
jgi:iron complex outermembrane receptor protein